MARTAPYVEPVDSERIERRTQAIGRELIHAAARAAADGGLRNRWTDQVLAWCTTDPPTKSAVLRLVDVLPSLTRAADIARHVREYFPRGMQVPVPLRLGAWLSAPALLTAPAVALVVRQMVEHVAAQFIAESRPDGVRQVVHALAAAGATCSLDVLGEHVVSDSEADAYAAQYVRVLQDAAAAYAQLPPGTMLTSCGPAVNVSVKPSALTPRFDPISPDVTIAAARRRLMPILHAATEAKALVNLDVEQFESRDLTMALATAVLSASDPPGPLRLGIVVQAYLRDAELATAELLQWLAANQRQLTVRLVKGAYWDYEIARAAQQNWPSPVLAVKSETDAQFERLTVRLLQARPSVRLAVGSHNVRSIAHAMAAAEAFGIPAAEIEFQLLYGMGEALRAAIAARGFPVRIYTPIGALIPGMAYLVRRLLENTANESVLRQDVHADAATILRAPPRVAPRTAPVPATASWQREPPLDFARAEHRERMHTALQHVLDRCGARYPLLLGDRPVNRNAERTVYSPACWERLLGSVATASAQDAAQAVAVAVDAQSQWAAASVARRIACLRRAAVLMRDRRAVLAAWEVLEVGKPWREADADVAEAIDYLEYYAAQAERLARGQALAAVPGERNEYVYVPRGVAAVIAPWNFPLAIATGMVSAALVTGNAVVFKPAEQSSIIGWHLVQLLREAGVPPPVVQCLPGDGPAVGGALARDARVAQVLFTGSRAVGLEIVRAAAALAAAQRHIKHVVAEMGGKNALIVDADADLDSAVDGVLQSAFGYAGQKCSAASRLIVLEDVAEPFLARLCAATDRLVIGDPVDPAVDLGPLIDDDAQQRLRGAAARAAADGRVLYRYPEARLPDRGFYVAPLIVSDLPPTHAIAAEELFGPLLTVFRVRRFADAIALANDTDYALTGGLYSRSPARIAQARARLDVGNLYINRPITGAIVGRQPFGGHRLSGLGTKAGGPDYLLQLVLPKTITEDTRRHGMPV